MWKRRSYAFPPHYTPECNPENGYCSSREGTMCLMVYWVIETKVLSEDETFLRRVCFSVQAIFYASGKLNKHNVRIWGSEHPRVTRELHRACPKVNAWCGIMRNQMSIFFPRGINYCGYLT